MTEGNAQLSHLLDRILVNFSECASCTRHGNRVTRCNRVNPLTGAVRDSNDASNETSVEFLTSKFSPVGLNDEFAKVYQSLETLVLKRQQNQSRSASSCSVMVQGPSGSGKSLLVRQCLAALSFATNKSAVAGQQRSTNKVKPAFRTVHITRLIPASNIVYEIVRQLSDAAMTGESSSDKDGNDNFCTLSPETDTRKRPRTENDSPQKSRAPDYNPLLRLKQTSFANHLQLLNEILRYAAVDGVPIVFVLELDTLLQDHQQSHALVSSFGNSVNRENHSNAAVRHHSDAQLLLYHLLDRITTHTCLGLIGITSTSSLLQQLEKRIASRAEGACQFIYLSRAPKSFDTLRDALLDKLVVATEAGWKAGDEQTQLLNAVRGILSPPSPAEETDEQSHSVIVYDTLERSYRLGKGIRWFCRVFYLALSLYREDIIYPVARRGDDDKTNETFPEFSPSYVKEALMDMGATLVLKSKSSSWTSRTELNIPAHRLEMLRDLSEPQVALLLATRRILYRESQRTDEKSNNGLTLHRILTELQTSTKNGMGMSNRFPSTTLQRAFLDLCDMAMFRPAVDHSGTTPFQYRHSHVQEYDYSHYSQMPIHITVDIYREILPALEKNVFHCSTALREWGKKTN